MVKKIFIFICCLIILTGCWDRRELTEIGIVVGTALDKDPSTGEVIVTVQIVRPSALKIQDGSKEATVELSTGRGRTVFEAIRNITKQFDRKAFHSHNKIIIISEKLAREGMLHYIDLIMRDHETRKSVFLFITKETQAFEALGTEHGIENVQASYLENIIKLKNGNSQITRTTLLDFLKKLYCPGINPVTGVASIIQQPTFLVEEKEGIAKSVNVSGTAVFKKDKLIGYLNDIETRGLNWVINKVNSGIININSPLDTDNLIAIEIISAKSTTKPEIKDNEYFFTIQVKMTGTIGETQGQPDISDIETLKKIEDEVENSIQKEIKTTINKIQKKLKSDILGFGKTFSKKYPKEWRKIENKWEDIFSFVHYSTEVDVQLIHSGLMLKENEPKS